MVQAMAEGKLSGAGKYGNQCQSLMAARYGFQKTLLTTSCSDALEMCAMLARLKEGDEVIMPSYTFVSTANAFVREGAKIVFADSLPGHPNIDPDAIESLINPKTRAVVVVHYGGVEPPMERISALCRTHGLLLIEDAAQSIHSRDKNGDWLGKKGDLAVVSFHDSKNLGCGEGGMLIINNPNYNHLAEILWEKGTNRYDFSKGKTDKYEWLEVGSSFLLADLNAAYLLAQLENAEEITRRRREAWDYYAAHLQRKEEYPIFNQQAVTDGDNHNAHIFFILLENKACRDILIQKFKEKQIIAVSHYLALHQSPYYTTHHGYKPLPNAEKFEDCLLRLPMYNDITRDEQDRVIEVLLA